MCGRSRLVKFVFIQLCAIVATCMHHLHTGMKFLNAIKKVHSCLLILKLELRLHLCCLVVAKWYQSIRILRLEFL